MGFYDPMVPKIIWFEHLRFVLVGVAEILCIRSLSLHVEQTEDVAAMYIEIITRLQMADFPQKLEGWIKVDRHHQPNAI